MKIALLIILLISSLFHLNAQELNCEVSVITNSKLEVSTTEREILDELQQKMKDFMNNTKWTDDQFEIEERINCTMQFQISKIPTQGVYEGFLQIQSTRPVFNTSYNTTVVKHVDENVTIQYTRNSIVEFAPNEYRDNLTSIMAFYAYYIIGMDYDSFSLKGGSPYFEKAFNIVNLAQSSQDIGWSNRDPKRKSRYNLADNIQSQIFEPLRDCNYKYHRQGLDRMYEKQEEGLKTITAAIEELSAIAKSRPNSANVIEFVQAKKNELKSFFTDASQQDKTTIVNLLKKLDPVNSSQYEEILL